MEKAWAIIIDDDQAACMMAIPRLFEQLRLYDHCIFLSTKCRRRKNTLHFPT
ncbi:hypothetical protein [Endozoicomonas atrinae]|uniref:hypothetical protein n=1 Tax=Endozoicomonas atrinae TaxID=1333660 RepID=UPI003AFFF05D